MSTRRDGIRVYADVTGRRVEDRGLIVGGDGSNTLRYPLRHDRHQRVRFDRKLPTSGGSGIEYIFSKYRLETCRRREAVVAQLPIRGKELRHLAAPGGADRRTRLSGGSGAGLRQDVPHLAVRPQRLSLRGSAPTIRIVASLQGWREGLERDPDDRARWNGPMAGAQRSCLDTLPKEAGEQIPANLSRADASSTSIGCRTAMSAQSANPAEVDVSVFKVRTSDPGTRHVG
nr:DUF3072 domain-containing protein [Microlunatus soli]